MIIFKIISLISVAFDSYSRTSSFKKKFLWLGCFLFTCIQQQMNGRKS